MNESYLEPGTYAINKRAGLGSFFIIPEKLIVHNEAFAVIYNVRPKTLKNKIQAVPETPSY